MCPAPGCSLQAVLKWIASSFIDTPREHESGSKPDLCLCYTPVALLGTVTDWRSQHGRSQNMKLRRQDPGSAVELGLDASLRARAVSTVWASHHQWHCQDQEPQGPLNTLTLSPHLCDLLLRVPAEYPHASYPPSPVKGQTLKTDTKDKE